MNIPENLLYTSEHEWIKIDGEIATIGVTDFAQSELGDIIFETFLVQSKLLKLFLIFICLSMVRFAK